MRLREVRIIYSLKALVFLNLAISLLFRSLGVKQHLQMHLKLQST